MITQIGLHSFKRFSELALETRSFTLLTGTNGSGKTSVIHALLLARQASMTASDTIQLNGPYGLQLGEGLDLLNHGADPSSGVGLDLEVDGGSYAWRFSMAEDRSLVLRVISRPHSLPCSLAAAGRSFCYLSADRLGPRDTLPAASSPAESLGVGPRGEHAAQVLSENSRVQISPGRRAPEMSQSSLQNQLEAWMTRIARPLVIKAQWFAGSGITQLQYKTPGVRHEWVRPPNMGFGVSTVLPALVAGLTVPHGGLLMIENPEIHLHPSGQSAVGQFLAQVAADGVQVIVETHSDHVVNGPRRAVAVGTLPAQDSVIYYFDDVVKEITLTKSGKLSDWPPGFFDQLSQDLGALARHKREL